MENFDINAILANINFEEIAAFFKGLLEVVANYVKTYFAK